MNNQQQVAAALRKLEADFGSDVLLDFFQGFHDVIVRGESFDESDNPHLPTEQPCHNLYHLGATTAEKLLSQLKQN